MVNKLSAFSGLILSLAFLAGCASNSQPPIPDDQKVKLEEVNGNFQYTEVVREPGSAEELYDRARVWVTRNYVSANEVIQLDDKDNKQLIVKGVFTGSYLLNKVWLYHTLEIRTKEGRYQIRYDNFRYTANSNDNGVSYRAAFDRAISEESIVSQTEDKIARSIIDLESHMATAAQDEEW